MILMTVFLVLTLVFIIGTSIYLNNKKKNINSDIKSNQKQENNKNSKNKLSDILNIKISGNIISLGNRFSEVINRKYINTICIINRLSNTIFFYNRIYWYK